MRSKAIAPEYVSHLHVSDAKRKDEASVSEKKRKNELFKFKAFAYFFRARCTKWQGRPCKPEEFTAPVGSLRIQGSAYSWSAAKLAPCA